MLDTDTFLTTLYTMVDDFCQSLPPSQRRPGPQASLTRSEVVTLALFGQWRLFASERDFYRFAERHLRGAFPSLPDRGQFNRLLREHQPAIEAFFCYLAERLEGGDTAYEALDGSGVPTRNVKRRGRGWLAGQANVGWSNRLGWYEGFHLLLASNPRGVITGFGFAPGSTADQSLAETFLALRAGLPPDGSGTLPTVGKRASGPYVTDKGFAGQENHRRWQQEYDAAVLCPPQRSTQQRSCRRVWSKELRRWVAGLRQIVETTFGKLQSVFRLGADRPHSLEGFTARLAAKMALHNFCIWLNEQAGRPSLAFADLLDW
jgi:Transposase DDE domain